MAKANAILFTDEELQTIVGTFNAAYHRRFLRNLEAEKSGEDQITERMAEICRKAYEELIRRQS